MNWGHFIAAMHAYGADTRDAAKRNLGSRGRGVNKTWGVTKNRTLQKSLQYVLNVEDDGTIRMALEATGAAQAYGKFVEMGVSGTATKYDTPYQYTSKMPPISAILEWMDLKPVRLRDKTTGKFVTATPELKRATAFRIAKAIQRNGVPPLRFASEGIEYAREKHQPLLGKAAAMDVMVYMRNNLNEIPKL